MNSNFKPLALAASLFALGTPAVAAAEKIVPTIDPRILEGANAQKAMACVVGLGFPEIADSRYHRPLVQVTPQNSYKGFDIEILTDSKSPGTKSIFNSYGVSAAINTETVSLSGKSALPLVKAVLDCVQNAVPKAPSAQLLQPMRAAATPK